MYENTLYQLSKILPASKRQILYCQKRADMTSVWGKKIKLGGSFRMICNELEVPIFYIFFFLPQSVKPPAVI